MSRTLGEAFVSVRPDTRGFAGETQRGISPGLKKVAGVIAGGLAGRQVLRGVADVVGRASDLNETVSKSNVIFRRQAGSVQTWSKTASRSLGLSEQAALASVTSFGDMFRQLGFTGKQSAQTSKTVVALASDLGSFNNVDPSDVLERISASFRGEYDSLQQLIPNISAARVEQTALAQTGKKTAKELTAQEKATATLAIIQRDGARAQGDFKRTSQGLANQQRIAGAMTDELKAKIGKALLPTLTAASGVLTAKVLPKLDQLADKYLPRVSAATTRFVEDFDFDQLSGRIGKVVDGIDWSKMGAQLGDIARDGGKLKPLLSDLAGQLPAINDLFSVTGEVVGFAADHTDLLAKALPYLVAGYAAVKLAQLGSNIAMAASPGLRLAEVLATRAQTAAIREQTLALRGSTAAGALDDGMRRKSIAAMAAQRVGAIASTIAQKVAAGATRVWAVAQWLLNAAMRANPIAKVITVLSLLGAGLVLAYKKSETFRNIVDGAWKVIRAGLASAWGFIQPVLAAIGSWVGSRLPKVFGVLRGIASTVFGALGRGISAVWKNVISPVFEGLKTGIRVVRDVFGNIVGGIGRVFDRLKAIVMTPIQWVVDNVINKLIDAVNAVANKLGKKGKLLGHVSLGGGSGDPKKGNPTVLKRAGGGPITGRSPHPRADNIPVAATAGEFMQRVAAVQKYGTSFMERVNSGRFPLELAHAPAGFMDAVRAGGTDLLHRAKGGLINPEYKRVRPLANSTASTYAGHTGADFNAPNDYGKPIQAAAAGRVSAVKHLATSYGNHVWLQHPGGISTIYAHMSKTLAKVGQQVPAGAMIGRVGSTGNSSGPHLHFEVRPGGTFGAAMAFLRGAKNVGVLKGGGEGVDAVAAITAAIKGIRAAIGSKAKDVVTAALSKGTLSRAGSAALNWASLAPGKFAANTNEGKLLGKIRDKVFDRGGIAKSAGIMAKGTVKPERVLSPKQTQLFDRLVAALDSRRLAALEQLTKDQARETRQLRKSKKFRQLDDAGQKKALDDLAARQKKKRQDTTRTLGSEQRTQLARALGAGVQLGKLLSAGFAKGLAGNREQVAARFEPVMAAVTAVGDKRLTELATRARAAVLKVAGDYEAAVARTAAAREALASLRETAASYSADLAKNGVDSGDIATSTDTSLPGVVAFLKDAAAKITGRTDLTTRLSKAGLSPAAIGQIVAEGGTRSQSVADSILAGGPAAIKKVNALMAQLQTASATYGRTASAAVYGSQIRASEATVAALKAAEGPLVAQMTQLGRSMVRALSAQLPGANAVKKKNLTKLLAGVGTAKTSAKVKKAVKGRTISKSSTFDDGGLARGIGDMSKRTIRPERVLSGRQTDAFEAWLSSGPGKSKGGDITIQQNFPSTATPRAAADAAGGRVVDALSAVGITRKP